MMILAIIMTAALIPVHNIQKQGKKSNLGT
jgi:hypothetical protein